MKESNLIAQKIPAPLSTKNRILAQKLAKYQLKKEKSKQVYLNTLAVCAVNNYLSLLGIVTNFQTSNSFNPLVCSTEDIGELEITGKGLLECRGIETNELNCYIPQEAQLDRIGYVVVEIDLKSDSANLLGFTNRVDQELININTLFPPLDLIERINKFRRIINLGEWLKNNIFQTDWLSKEEFFPNWESLTYRSCLSLIQRCKLIEITPQNCSVILTILLENKVKKNINISIEIEPLNQIYLPPELEINILDSENNRVMQAKSKYDNQSIKFKFKGEEGDLFSFQLLARDFCFQENFML